MIETQIRPQNVLLSVLKFIYVAVIYPGTAGTCYVAMLLCAMSSKALTIIQTVDVICGSLSPDIGYIAVISATSHSNDSMLLLSTDH